MNRKQNERLLTVRNELNSVQSIEDLERIGLKDMFEWQQAQDTLTLYLKNGEGVGSSTFNKNVAELFQQHGFTIKAVTFKSRRMKGYLIDPTE